MGTRSVDLTSQIDGARTVFDLPGPFQLDTVQVHLDGILQLPGEYYVETPPSQITTNEAPTPGQELQAQYEEFYQAPSDGYASVADMREEGVTEAMASDAAVSRAIGMATAFIECVTGRYFVPRTLDLRLDGRGGRMLLLDVPIVKILSIKVSTDETGGTDVDPSYYKVYNRHLTEGLLQPDDRNNPRIELIQLSPSDWDYQPYFGSNLVWPIGAQNIRVRGVFGYTESDGTEYGRTPSLIWYACKQITLRYLPKLTDLSRDETIKRGWITSERTKEQSISFADPRSHGMATGFTGDPEIDQILASFMRPPAMGAA